MDKRELREIQAQVRRELDRVPQSDDQDTKQEALRQFEEMTPKGASDPEDRRLRARNTIQHSFQAIYAVADVFRHVASDENRFQMAGAMIGDVMKDFQPRNAAERMLVEQMMVTHTQVIHLQRVMTKIQSIEQLEKISLVISRLQADYRKNLLALKEWRSPTRNLILAKQANIANQQIVHQDMTGNTNELGSKDA